ncbi:hypothetical protein [Amycolatopsis sp. H20-H5]|uniref:hypothetical protein n=1 Tax=Amycolatopsis sp. H20-H5 TaxID=3046309 RepID=UPI002DBE1481|nr:hypothetical protein [Amycolatopsis sp. H20-H5]MEC3980405.1 hypothetical protein [Amycolatopsis sp. H20-H5]
MLFYLALFLLCLPLLLWFGCMILYTVLSPVVFWLLVVGLAAGTVAVVVRRSKA